MGTRQDPDLEPMEKSELVEAVLAGAGIDDVDLVSALAQRLTAALAEALDGDDDDNDDDADDAIDANDQEKEEECRRASHSSPPASVQSEEPIAAVATPAAASSTHDVGDAQSAMDEGWDAGCLLREMFQGRFSSAEVGAALVNKGGDLEATIEGLLQQQEEGMAKSVDKGVAMAPAAHRRPVPLDFHFADALEACQQAPDSSVPGRGICRHFLAGKCLRADCPFRHDIEAEVCSFWRKGKCRAGSACPFLHPPREGSRRRRGRKNGSKESTPTPSPSSTQPAEAGEGSTLPEVDFRLPAPELDTPQPGGEWAAVAGAKVPASREAVVPSPASLLPSQGLYGQRHRHAAPRGLGKEVEGVPWVSTGQEVAALYHQVREEAEAHALARHRCFTEASHAYLSGKKAEAKALSRQGREHGTQMEALHAVAADQIFDRRNPSGGHSGPEGSLVVDLHGLHPQEAAARALRLLRDLRRSTSSSRQRGSLVYFITGVGRHSAAGDGSRLAEAVWAAVEAEPGFRCEDASARGHGGILRVCDTASGHSAWC